MYIRESKTKNKDTGSVYTSHQLVETLQTEKGPRNRILLYLGQLSLPKASWKILTRALEDRLAGRRSLIPPAPEIKAVVDAVMEANKPENRGRKKKKNGAPRPTGTAVVTTDSLETGEVRTLGSELVGHQAWNRLDIDSVLIASGFSARERALACAVVVGRLVSPGSELHTHRWIASQSAIGEIVGQEIGALGKDAVYEIADLLWENREALEAQLSRTLQETHPVDSLVFLYDLTNTYFEGTASGNPLARRGHSKEKRTDCPLIGLSLVVDQRGFPIQSHVTAGNQSEPETLPAVLDRLEERLAKTDLPLRPAKPTLVMDRGIATTENLALLRERNFPFCVVERRAAEKDHIELFARAQETFEWFAPDPDKPEEGVFLHKCPPKEGTVQLLVLSESRKAKEEAMDNLKEIRFLKELQAMRDSVEKRPALADSISRRIGRLEGRYPSVAKYYRIVPHLAPPKNGNDPVPERKPRKNQKKPKPVPARVDRIEWEKKPARETRKDTTGAYVIETSETRLSGSGIWSLYTTLTRVEKAFRCLKTDLGLRPVHHQTADRSRAHLFLSVLAYFLLSEIEYRMSGKGDSRAWSTLREILNSHVRATVSGSDPFTRILHTLRLSSTPEPEQKAIYKLLGVKDPTPRVKTRTPLKEVSV